ncbi:small, acid-soluble spore protein L [Ectobacillus funiculus]
MGKKQKNRGTDLGTSVNPQGLTPDEASRDPKKLLLKNRAKKQYKKI